MQEVRKENSFLGETIRGYEQACNLVLTEIETAIFMRY